MAWNLQGVFCEDPKFNETYGFLRLRNSWYDKLIIRFFERVQNSQEGLSYETKWELNRIPKIICKDIYFKWELLKDSYMMSYMSGSLFTYVGTYGE